MGSLPVEPSKSIDNAPDAFAFFRVYRIFPYIGSIRKALTFGEASKLRGSILFVVLLFGRRPSFTETRRDFLRIKRNRGLGIPAVLATVFQSKLRGRDILQRSEVRYGRPLPLPGLRSLNRQAFFLCSSAVLSRSRTIRGCFWEGK